MISILPLVGPLTKLATATIEHVNLRRSSVSHAEKETQMRRLEELERSDLEQGELLSELSKSVRQLANAVENHIDGTQRLYWLACTGIILSLASITLAILTYIK